MGEYCVGGLSVFTGMGKLNILLIYGLDILQSAIFFEILMYLISKQQADWGQMLFALLFIGGFVCFFGEAKCRYVLPFFFLVIPYSVLGYRELWRTGFPKLQILRTRGRNEGKVHSILCVKNWNRLHTTLVVLGLLIFLAGVSDNIWICNSLKLNGDTEAYYEYIHQYNHNFINLKF